MFDSTKEVPSLELCKKLKELGYPQHHYGFILAKFKKEEDFCLLYNEGDYDKDMLKFYFDEWHKAPTVRELGEWLPDEITKNDRYYYLNIWKTGSMWGVKYQEDNNNICRIYYADTEANARAKMLIWLVENGHVSFKGGHND